MLRVLLRRFANTGDLKTFGKEANFPVNAVLCVTPAHRSFSNTQLLFSNYLDEVQRVKKLDKKLIELKEEDLDESHVRGWGGGGQKVNKTANCVHLRHKPTGLIVRVHTSRSLVDNKSIARARLRMKVDAHVRGDESVIVQEEKQKMIKNRSQKIKAVKNLEGKSNLKKLLKSDDDVKY